MQVRIHAVRAPVRACIWNPGSQAHVTRVYGSRDGRTGISMQRESGMAGARLGTLKSTLPEPSMEPRWKPWALRSCQEGPEGAKITAQRQRLEGPAGPRTPTRPSTGGPTTPPAPQYVPKRSPGRARSTGKRRRKQKGDETIRITKTQG